jgi:hypothetical protein
VKRLSGETGRFEELSGVAETKVLDAQRQFPGENRFNRQAVTGASKCPVRDQAHYYAGDVADIVVSIASLLFS